MSHPEESSIVVDENNGFDVVWRSGIETSPKYSLVRVPLDIPIHIVYNKPQLGIAITIKPTHTKEYWSMSGTFDSDIIANFGFRISQPRQGPIPPVLSQEDLRRLGRIDIIRSAKDPLQFCADDVYLYANRIEAFLYNVWQPRALAYGNVPTYYLEGDYNRDHRVLPQKFIKRIGDPVTLAVERVK